MIGCFWRLSLYVVVVAFYFPLLSIRSPFPTLVLSAEGVGIASGIAGFFSWLAILSLISIREGARDRIRLNKPPRDGERAVVSGPIEANAPLIRAPFSDRECVAYYYLVTRTATTTQTDGRPTIYTYYEGYAMTPALIHSLYGKFKILANADKELFHEVPECRPDGALKSATDYFASVNFAEEDNGPGDFRVDILISEPKSLSGCHLEEKIIQNNDPVLAKGIYSEKENGIRPNPDDINYPFRLIPGGEEVLKKKTLSSLKYAKVTAVLSFIVVIIYFIVFVPHYG